MEKKQLKAKPRTHKGKEACKKIRAGGEIPAVLYGGKGNRDLSLNAREFTYLFTSIHENSLLELDTGDGKSIEVFVKDFQEDPISRKIIHVDFFQVDPNKTIRMGIPINVTGSSEGVREGGFLQHILREALVECLPAAIPESFTVDVTDLKMGDAIHLRDG